jgi:hypothetical protein
MKTFLLVMVLLASLATVITAQSDDVNYVYDHGSRPDPFVPYKAPVIVIPPNQISVSGSKLVGITESHGNRIALFQAADNKVHFLKVGDRVYDGIVEKITPDSVVFRQFLPEGSALHDKEVVRYLYPEQH